jgi:hypothetical protein
VLSMTVQNQLDFYIHILFDFNSKYYCNCASSSEEICVETDKVKKIDLEIIGIYKIQRKIFVGSKYDSTNIRLSNILKKEISLVRACNMPKGTLHIYRTEIIFRKG